MAFDYDHPTWLYNVMFLPRDGNDFSAWIPRLQFHYLTRNQWNNLVSLVERWYDGVSEQEIEALNVPLEEKRKAVTGEYVADNGTTVYPEPAPRKRKVKGQVYLIRSAAGLYKIGRSKDAKTRFDNMKGGSPVPLFLECIITVEDMFALEDELQNRFLSSNTHHEWYDLSLADVEYIKELAQ